MFIPDNVRLAALSEEKRLERSKGLVDLKLTPISIAKFCSVRVVVVPLKQSSPIYPAVSALDPPAIHITSSGLVSPEMVMVCHLHASVDESEECVPFKSMIELVVPSEVLKEEDANAEVREAHGADAEPHDAALDPPEDAT